MSARRMSKVAEEEREGGREETGELPWISCGHGFYLPLVVLIIGSN